MRRGLLVGPACVVLCVALCLSCATMGSGGRGGAYADSLSAIDRDGEARARLAAAGMKAVASSALSRLSMDGSEWSDRAAELLSEAEDYVLVSSFLLTEHPNARKVVDAMVAARARGVRVYVLTDSASYFRTYPNDPGSVPSLIPYMKSRGIPVTEYNPITGRRIFTLLGLFDRDHRKFWVIDGRLAVVGGQNVDYDSLRPPEASGCVDAMAEFSSADGIRELRDSFVETWNAWSVDRLAEEDFAIRPCPQGVDAWIVDQANGKTGRVSGMFDALFERAGKSLLLVQCYTFLSPDLLARVRAAVERGVDVTFVLSEGHVAERFRYGSFYSIADLLDAGARVFLFEDPSGSLLHYKMIMADEAMVSIGSANFNLRSELLSRETSVVFDDEASAALVRARFDELKSRLREVGRDEARGYRGPAYFLYNLLMQVAG